MGTTSGNKVADLDFCEQFLKSFDIPKMKFDFQKSYWEFRSFGHKVIHGQLNRVSLDK